MSAILQDGRAKLLAHLGFLAKKIRSFYGQDLASVRIDLFLIKADDIAPDIYMCSLQNIQTDL